MTEDYSIPETNKILEKGIGVYIRLLALHHDPKYQDPCRFTDENVDFIFLSCIKEHALRTGIRSK